MDRIYDLGDDRAIHSTTTLMRDGIGSGYVISFITVSTCTPQKPSYLFSVLPPPSRIDSLGACSLPASSPRVLVSRPLQISPCLPCGNSSARNRSSFAADHTSLPSRHRPPQGHPKVKRRWLPRSLVHRLHVLGTLHGLRPAHHVRECRGDYKEGRCVRDLLPWWVIIRCHTLPLWLPLYSILDLMQVQADNFKAMQQAILSAPKASWLAKPPIIRQPTL